MVRESKIDEYGQQVVDAMNELLQLCKNNMYHSGDLLVCQQNGSMFANRPLIGPGEEGNEFIPRLNTITGKGIGDVTRLIKCQTLRVSKITFHKACETTFGARNDRNVSKKIAS